MCVQEKEQVSEGIMENLGGNGVSSGNDVDDEDCKPWSLHSQVELSPAQNETWGKNTSFDHPSPLRNSSRVRRKTFFWILFAFQSHLFFSHYTDFNIC